MWVCQAIKKACQFPGKLDGFRSLRTYVVVLETGDLLRSALNDYDLSLGFLRHVGIFLLGVGAVLGSLGRLLGLSGLNTELGRLGGVSAGTAAQQEQRARQEFQQVQQTQPESLRHRFRR